LLESLSSPFDFFLVFGMESLKVYAKEIEGIGFNNFVFETNP
jgi:hypothetical protein